MHTNLNIFKEDEFLQLNFPRPPDQNARLNGTGRQSRKELHARLTRPAGKDGRVIIDNSLRL